MRNLGALSKRQAKMWRDVYYTKTSKARSRDLPCAVFSCKVCNEATPTKLRETRLTKL